MLNTIIHYKYSEDLSTRTFLLEKPLSTESTPLSYGAFLERGIERKPLFDNSEILKEGFLNFNSKKPWFIYSSNEYIKYRIGMVYITEISMNNKNFKATIPNNILLNISM